MEPESDGGNVNYTVHDDSQVTLVETVRPPTNEAHVSETGLAPDDESYGERQKKGGLSQRPLKSEGGGPQRMSTERTVMLYHCGRKFSLQLNHSYSASKIILYNHYIVAILVQSTCHFYLYAHAVC